MVFNFLRSKLTKKSDFSSTGNGTIKEVDTTEPVAQPDSEINDENTIEEIDISAWPPAIHCSPEQPTTDAFLGSIKQADPHLDIKIGKDKFIRRWRVHKELLCRYSGYFRQACEPTGIAAATFQEGEDGVFDLHDDNPAAFGLFLDWLYGNKDDPVRTLFYDLSDWNVYPVEAYALGDKLMADDFRAFALKHAINSARYFDRRDIELVFELTGEHDPLYRFTCRWLRWRCWEDPHLWSSSQNEILQNERQRQEPSSSVAGKDPREFFAQHWFQPCSETSLVCGHQAAATVSPFHVNENNCKLGWARMRRAWIRRKAYGRRHQYRRCLAAFGLFVSGVI